MFIDRIISHTLPGPGMGLKTLPAVLTPSSATASSTRVRKKSHLDSHHHTNPIPHYLEPYHQPSSTTIKRANPSNPTTTSTTITNPIPSPPRSLPSPSQLMVITIDPYLLGGYVRRRFSAYLSA